MKENTTIENHKNIKILLKNKPEISGFIKIFLKKSWRKIRHRKM